MRRTTMTFEDRYVSIRDIVRGYNDDADNGVYAYNGRLNVRPLYQREYIFDDKTRNGIIDSVLRGYSIKEMYWVENEDGSYEVLDGQQRTLSICKYYNNEYSVKFDNGLPMYFNNLSDEDREYFLNYRVTIKVCRGERDDILEWFKRSNTGCIRLTEQEIRNAVYSGRWVEACKPIFSRKNSMADKKGKNYLRGKVERQEYFETALIWAADKEGLTIDEYMANHQEDPDAVELKTYFMSVIEWVNAKFPNYRKEMKGIEWGCLYNRYHQNRYDANELESDISELMTDEDVTNKRGIYEYLLSGREKVECLNLRAFPDSLKQKKYDEQQGICPICGKHFTLSEMEADHIIPWSQGGKTTEDNLQMLCKSCNRKKSDK